MAKRGQNEGSIYQRKDGRWTAAFSIGRAKRKAFYGKTRREVQEKLTAALRDKHLGLPVITDQKTVARFLDEWLQESAKPSVRARTFIRYEELVRLHLKPLLGYIRLAKLSPQQLQAAMTRWSAQGLAPRTVEQIRAVLRRALNQALRWNLVTRNVATLVDSPKYERAKIRVLSPDEARTFVQAVQADDYGALYLTALTLGLREGEVLGLRWEDVDLESRMLRVSYSLQRIEGKLQLVPPKTERSRRTLTIPAVLISALRAHRVRQMEWKLALGVRWQETGFVFTTPIGTPIDARNMQRRYYSSLSKAGLPKLRFHDLRHSCASLLLAQNVPARVVMELLGHSQIKLTLDTYSHVMPALLKDASSAIDRVLRS
jgi:integrase